MAVQRLVRCIVLGTFEVRERGKMLYVLRSNIKEEKSDLIRSYLRFPLLGCSVAWPGSLPVWRQWVPYGRCSSWPLRARGGGLVVACGAFGGYAVYPCGANGRCMCGVLCCFLTPACGWCWHAGCCVLSGSLPVCHYGCRMCGVLLWPSRTLVCVTGVKRCWKDFKHTDGGVWV